MKSKEEFLKEFVKESEKASDLILDTLEMNHILAPVGINAMFAIITAHFKRQGLTKEMVINVFKSGFDHYEE